MLWCTSAFLTGHIAPKGHCGSVLDSPKAPRYYYALISRLSSINI